jgi:crotonobetainyl-CoA:carnitine CoA-transferase CaiB-like acyl-CoA transferase
MRETMAQGLVVGLVQSPEQVVNSPHLAERGYFVELTTGERERSSIPGRDSSSTGENADADDSRAARRRPARKLGEHNIHRDLI